MNKAALNLINSTFARSPLPATDYLDNQAILAKALANYNPAQLITALLLYRIAVCRNRGSDTKQASLPNAPDAVDEATEEYEAALLDLIDKGSSEKITELKFETDWLELTLAIITLMVLAGSALSSLTEAQEEEISRQMTTSAAQLPALIEEVFRGDFIGQDGEPPKKDSKSRVFLWLNIASGFFEFGQEFDPDDPWYEWQLGKSDHCRTCIALNGVIRKASGWRLVPFTPRYANGALECGGYNCQCRRIKVDNPSNKEVGVMPKVGK